MKSILWVLLGLFFCLTRTSTCNEVYQEYQQIVTQNILLTEGIISLAPEVIKWADGDKIYLDESHVKRSAQNSWGAHVRFHQEHEVYLPMVLSDENGFFTSVSRFYWDKPFHQRCNNCRHEWQSRGITFRCPRCGSTDISNVRS